MPLYDYDCAKCGVVEALRQRAVHETRCPKCGGPATRRFPAPNLRRDGTYSYRQRNHNRS